MERLEFYRNRKEALGISVVSLVLGIGSVIAGWSIWHKYIPEKFTFIHSMLPVLYASIYILFFGFCSVLMFIFAYKYLRALLKRQLCLAIDDAGVHLYPTRLPDDHFKGDRQPILVEWQYILGFSEVVLLGNIMLIGIHVSDADYLMEREIDKDKKAGMEKLVKLCGVPYGIGVNVEGWSRKELINLLNNSLQDHLRLTHAAKRS
jgi:hypothetical protein